MFRKELEDLKNRYMTRLTLHTVFSQEHMDSPLYSGRLTQDKLGEFFGTLIRAPQIDHALPALNMAGPMRQTRRCWQRVCPKNVSISSALAYPTAKLANKLNKLPGVGDAPAFRVAIIRDGLTREIEFRTEHGNVLRLPRCWFGSALFLQIRRVLHLPCQTD